MLDSQQYAALPFIDCVTSNSGSALTQSLGHRLNLDFLDQEYNLFSTWNHDFYKFSIQNCNQAWDLAMTTAHKNLFLPIPDCQMDWFAQYKHWLGPKILHVWGFHMPVWELRDSFSVTRATSDCDIPGYVLSPFWAEGRVWGAKATKGRARISQRKLRTALSGPRGEDPEAILPHPLSLFTRNLRIEAPERSERRMEDMWRSWRSSEFQTPCTKGGWEGCGLKGQDNHRWEAVL
jgi:hypothetical protein